MAYLPISQMDFGVVQRPRKFQVFYDGEDKNRLALLPLDLLNKVWDHAHELIVAPFIAQLLFIQRMTRGHLGRMRMVFVSHDYMDWLFGEGGHTLDDELLLRPRYTDRKYRLAHIRSTYQERDQWRHVL